MEFYQSDAGKALLAGTSSALEPAPITAAVTKHNGAKNMAADGGSTSIMEFSQDLSTQEAPPPLPASTYPAEIISAAFKTSATSGNTYCAIQFRISADEYPADFTDGDPDGTVLTYNRLVIADAPRERYRLRKFIEAVGGKLGRSFDPSDILGLTGNIEVVQSEYEGETRAEIKRVVAG
jgi:hypothetical protein